MAGRRADGGGPACRKRRPRRAGGATAGGPLGRSDARAGLDHRTPDRAPVVDRPGRPDRGHRRGAGSPKCWRPRQPIRPVSSTRLPRNWRRWRPPNCSPTGGSPAGGCTTRCLAVPDGRKLPWFGPPMSAASMATARLMETWAHGLDVADALGVKRPATERLRSIAHIGVRTRDYAFVINNLTPPTEPFLVELRGPGGDTWSWGPPDAAQRVTGSAEDFCFLVTQRRPLGALDITAQGRRRAAVAADRPGVRGPARPRSMSA